MRRLSKKSEKVIKEMIEYQSKIKMLQRVENTIFLITVPSLVIPLSLMLFLTVMDTVNIKDSPPLVSRTSRYIGHEINSITKDPSSVKISFALGFPDVYEVGMSHLGLQILYQTINARTDVSCERVFSPWKDMEALLREKGVPLGTLESGRP